MPLVRVDQDGKHNKSFCHLKRYHPSDHTESLKMRAHVNVSVPQVLTNVLVVLLLLAALAGLKNNQIVSSSATIAQACTVKCLHLDVIQYILLSQNIF